MTIAFGQAAANIARIRQAAANPEATDALQVLDTQVNLGAASSQAKQDAEVAAVKAPQPEYNIKIGADGQQVVDAKNVPLTSPVDQSKQAEAAPYARYAQSLQETLAQAQRVKAGLADPEGTDIDEKLKTRQGRDALGHEIGADRAYRYGDTSGLMDWARKGDEYDALLNDPARLRRMVASHRLQQRLDVDKEASPAFHELAGTAQQDIREKREARSAESQGVRETMNAVHGMDLTGFKTPDEAVETMSKLFPDAAKRDGFAEAVKAAHSAQSYARSRKELQDQILQAKNDRDEKRVNELTDLWHTMEANTRQQMNVRGQEHQLLSQDDLAYITRQQDSGVDASQLPKLSGPQQLQLARFREAQHQDILPAMRGPAADALAKNDAVRANTAELKASLEPFKNSEYWNVPFEQLPNRVKYQLGMASADQIGKLQSKFQIEQWAGTMALVRGIRNGEILKEVGQHLPRFGHDSLALMYDKLSNADDYYQQQESAIKKYGNKSGVVPHAAPAGGGTADDPLGIRRH